MQDSPSVEIRLVTTDHAIAKAKLQDVKKEEKEWMKDVDEDSGNWAEAKMCELQLDDGIAPGDYVFIVTYTKWLECVETTLNAFSELDAASAYIDEKKEELKAEFDEIAPFDEDESFAESMHLADESVMVDAYFEIKAFKFVKPIKFKSLWQIIQNSNS